MKVQTNIENELISTLEIGNIKVYLGDYANTRNNRLNYSYLLKWNDKPIFCTDDYSPSPLHEVNSVDAIVGLLGFLCVQDGDVEEDYFKSYTKEQIAFRDSNDCENLNCIISDFEDSGSEYYQESLETLTKGFKQYK